MRKIKRQRMQRSSNERQSGLSHNNAEIRKLQRKKRWGGAVFTSFPVLKLTRRAVEE